jgi:signal transduction histidine kinase
MGRLIHSLWVRVTSVVLVIHAALLPLLYLGMSTIVEDGYAELFVNPVRAYSRLVADELEAVSEQDFPRRAATLLDGVVLSGQVVYAEIIDGSHTLRSPLSSVSENRYRGDDFYFGDHGDQVYYISHPVKRGGRSVTLRLGFDESPTLARIVAAKRRVLAAILAFTVISIAMAIWLAAVIARPMVRLQDAAKRVAGGDFHAHLQMDSSIREVRELTHHLERMRQELVGTNDRLQREIREREVSEQKGLELERRLRHRERIATIGTLAGGIAHEFNNIMTPILLYAQLALDDIPRDTALANDLTRIVTATHRARSLVTRILTFSREMDLQEPRVFPLSSVVEEALALIRAMVPANIEIQFRSGDAAANVLGDPGQLHQVVVNLCTNACQAMRASGGQLAVQVVEVENPGDGHVSAGRYTLLEVSDTGHGMDEAVLTHIFEPFFTTRDVGEGTGLGLSVAHGIVTSMGGTITVDSAVGRGTVFRVYFPDVARAVHERDRAMS